MGGRFLVLRLLLLFSFFSRFLVLLPLSLGGIIRGRIVGVLIYLTVIALTTRFPGVGFLRFCVFNKALDGVEVASFLIVFSLFAGVGEVACRDNPT